MNKLPKTIKPGEEIEVQIAPYGEYVCRDGNTPDARVSNNKFSAISGGTASGIRLARANGATIITENDFSAVSPAIRQAGTGTVDARNNWWNSATGPKTSSNLGGTGSQYNGTITFSPWLGDGTDTDEAIGFQTYYEVTSLAFSTQPGNAVAGD